MKTKLTIELEYEERGSMSGYSKEDNEDELLEEIKSAFSEHWDELTIVIKKKEEW